MFIYINHRVITFYTGKTHQNKMSILKNLALGYNRVTFQLLASISSRVNNFYMRQCNDFEQIFACQYLLTSNHVDIFLKFITEKATYIRKSYANNLKSAEFCSSADFCSLCCCSNACPISSNFIFHGWFNAKNMGFRPLKIRVEQKILHLS